jgi:thiol-disulfide isomerase/thioredoxin
MQSKILLSSILLLFSINIVPSQDWSSQGWVFKLIQSNSGKNASRALEKEMRTFIGTKAQNIRFCPIKDTSASDNLENHRGKVLIIQLATTSCAGCKMQSPKLSRIQEKYAKHGVEVIYLFFAHKDFLKKNYDNQRYSGIIASLEDQHFSRPFQTMAFPTAYIIDPNGIIKDCWVIPETFNTIEKKLQKSLTLNK